MGRRNNRTQEGGTQGQDPQGSWNRKHAQEQTVDASRIDDRIQANKFEKHQIAWGKFFAIRNETTVRNLLCAPETNIEES